MSEKQSSFNFLATNQRSIHIISEVLVMLGITVYFYRKNSELQDIVKKLHHQIEDQENVIDELRNRVDMFGTNISSSFTQIQETFNQQQEDIARLSSLVQLSQNARSAKNVKNIKNTKNARNVTKPKSKKTVKNVSNTTSVRNSLKPQAPKKVTRDRKMKSPIEEHIIPTINNAQFTNNTDEDILSEIRDDLDELDKELEQEEEVEQIEEEEQEEQEEDYTEEEVDTDNGTHVRFSDFEDPSSVSGSQIHILA